MYVILMLLLEALLWFTSALPIFAPYQILLLYKNRKNHIKVSLQHITVVYIFIYFLTLMLGLTGIPSINDIYLNKFGIITSHGLNISSEEINIIPFYWISKGFRPYLENIILFIPFGFLLPFIWKKYEPIWKTVLYGSVFSLIIELSQLFNRRVTDIDDLLMNTFGTLIGWLIFKLLQKHIHGFCIKISIQSAGNEMFLKLFKKETFFCFLSAFAGIFITYHNFFIIPKFLK